MELTITHGYTMHISASPKAEAMHQDKTQSHLSESDVRRILSKNGVDLAGNVTITSDTTRRSPSQFGPKQHHYGGGHNIDVTTVIQITAAATPIALAVIKALKELLKKHIEEKGKRTLEIKIDGKTLKLKGAHEVDDVEKIIEKMRSE